MKVTAWCAAAVLAFAAHAAAADFGSKGGPQPANVDASRRTSCDGTRTTSSC